jgi:peptide chain release factor 1
MFERLNQIESKYDELNKALSSPELINDSARYQKTAKAHSEVAEIVEKYREYKDLSCGRMRRKNWLGWASGWPRLKTT